MKIKSMIAVLMIVALRVGASEILWERPDSISLDSDVDNSLPVHSAINFGGDTLCVNGIKFAADGGEANGKSYPDFIYSWVSYPFSRDYRALLGGGRYDASRLVLNDLQPGHYYKVQIWACDGRGGMTKRNTILKDAQGNSACLRQATGTSSTDLGQHVSGYFTADSSSQVINISTTQESSLVNAVAVYRVSIPEPDTLGFISY